MMLRRILSLVFVLNSFLGHAFSSIIPHNQFGIYGTDSRLDAFSSRVDDWQRKAVRSTAVLIDRSSLEEHSSDLFELSLRAMGESGIASPMCSNERFYKQPVLQGRICSGFFVGEDIFVTAGHCMRQESDCDEMAVVFGYENSDPAQTLNKDNVYYCKELIANERSGAFPLGSDFAVFRLDRKISDREPLLVRSQGKIASNAQLTMIGHPLGLPTKVTTDGTVLKNVMASNFSASLSAYGGNSGSVVLNNAAPHYVEGILTGGNRDFVFDHKDRCYRSSVCPKNGCGSRGEGERVVRITVLADLISKALGN